MSEELSTRHRYLKINTVAGGLWVDFINILCEHLTADDEVHIQWIKFDDCIIFTSFVDEMVNKLQTIVHEHCQHYEGQLLFMFLTCTQVRALLSSEDAIIIADYCNWYDLFVGFERLLSYMSYERS